MAATSSILLSSICDPCFIGFFPELVYCSLFFWEMDGLYRIVINRSCQNIWAYALLFITSPGLFNVLSYIQTGAHHALHCHDCGFSVRSGVIQLKWGLFSLGSLLYQTCPFSLKFWMPHWNSRMKQLSLFLICSVRSLFTQRRRHSEIDPYHDSFLFHVVGGSMASCSQQVFCGFQFLWRHFHLHCTLDSELGGFMQSLIFGFHVDQRPRLY